MNSLTFFDRLKIPEGIRIPYIGGKLYNFLSNRMRCISKKIYEKLGENDKLKSCRNPRIIVSLTSFPARIDCVHLSIATLFRQTAKPDKIILWLAENQFPNHEIPDSLLKLQRLGLQIEYREHDIKGHKKYYYAMQEYPDDIIITVDDDLIYPETFLELLINSYNTNPNAIHCNRAQEIIVKNGEIMPYGKWKVLSKTNPSNGSIYFMPSTGGGTLYPPHILDDETFNLSKIMSFALTADDLWMKTMSLRKGIPIIKTKKYHRTFSTIDGSQRESLANENIFENKNNIILKNLIQEYPKAFNKLCKTL